MNDLNALREIMDSNLSAMSTVQLAEIYITAKAFSSKMYQLKTHIEGLIIKELRAQGAEKVLSCKTRTPITLGKHIDRKFDIEILEQELKPLVAAEQWDSIIKLEPKILWENLKDLRKTSSVIRDTIDKAVIELPKPELKIGTPSKIDKMLLARQVIPIPVGITVGKEAVISAEPSF
ncbi:MAG: hypothetical protein A2231_11440 [Candidatus Firestonebacteria bacterium RIFOXYA2_FULL_40_8]|nr:MAG: hypothetical protein A2231_11440 [Candidatus Firestonebacteria bacterium RIFOXYA2_FULL_40_8]